LRGKEVEKKLIPLKKGETFICVRKNFRIFPGETFLRVKIFGKKLSAKLGGSFFFEPTLFGTRFPEGTRFNGKGGPLVGSTAMVLWHQE